MEYVPTSHDIQRGGINVLTLTKNKHFIRKKKTQQPTTDDSVKESLFQKRLESHQGLKRNTRNHIIYAMDITTITTMDSWWL